jgi:DNA-binding SARP family transcriptional activator/tetratricopeptide (TPR) repeat protein
VRFRVIGPVEALAEDGGAIRLPPKPRALLAMLLLDAGRPVSRDRLMAALWRERPPPSAPRVIRTYVSALRQSLHLSRGDQLPRLVPLGDSYRLDVEPGDLDLLVFDDLAGRGQRALGDGDAAVAARLLDEALGLWRGEPAEDVSVDGETGALLAGLAERRLLAEEDRAEAGLVLGHDAALIASLRQLVTTHPLRERLWGQLMTALYRTGQQAAALDAYQQVRTRLVAELGVEPGAGLRELHQQILAGDTLPRPHRVAVPSSPVVPRQLPLDVSFFTGRVAELSQLDAALGAPGADSPGPAAIAVITGLAGSGKTALAIRWAHRAAGRFPDGQLYASLRGYSPAGTVSPVQVLAQFLRALGAEIGRIPGDLDEAAAMYRSLLDGKRILIVLDNAASSGQVRPLLPAAPGCAVVVTSRDRLPGLAARDGAARITLGALPPDEAMTLLRGILGPRRADTDLPATTDIAARCGFLPLALRIAADRVAARPHQSLAGLAAQLAAADDRLDMLTSSDDPGTSVRTVLSWSYQAQPADAERMFRLAALSAGPDISIPAAAALAAAGQAEARRLLEVLAGTHLLEEYTPCRYRFHDLLRIYAGEAAQADESEAARVAALQRMLTWYLHTAVAASRRLEPAQRGIPLGVAAPHCQPLPFATYHQALAWCDAEHENLLAAIEQAAATGHYDIGWQLPVTLTGFFGLRRRWADLQTAMTTAVTCARRCGDQHGLAWALDCLGQAHKSLRHYEEARSCYRLALSTRRDIGDRRGEGASLNNLGCTYWRTGQYADAARYYKQALDIARQFGNRHGEAIALSNLAEAYHHLGRLPAALDCYAHSLAIVREIGDLRGEGQTLQQLAAAQQAAGQHPQAEETYSQALAVRRRAGDRHGEAETLRDVGDLLHHLGRAGAAHASWQHALAAFEELGDPQAHELRARF